MRSSGCLSGRNGSESRCNGLWSFFYSIGMICAHGYLSVAILSEHRLITSSDAKGGSGLGVFILVVLAAVVTLVAAVLNIVKCGNYANDSQKLGKLVAKVINGEEAESGLIPTTRMQRLVKHAPPLGAMLHTTAAFLYLLPLALGATSRQVMNSDASISINKMLPGSELDGVFGRYPPPTVPAFANITAIRPPTPSRYTGVPSLPFINWIISLSIVTIRYPSVFWFTSKAISSIFAVYMTVALFNHIVAYTVFTVLYQISKGWTIANVDFGDLMILPAQGVVVLFLLGQGIIFFSSTIVFQYGHRQYYIFYSKCIAKFSTLFTLPEENTRVSNPDPAKGCFLYAPNATAMMILILTSVTKATLIYDMVTLYKYSKDSLILAAIILDCIYVLTWIGMWFAFTLKQNWSFHIQLPYNPAKEELTQVYPVSNPGPEGEQGESENRLVPQIIAPLESRVERVETKWEASQSGDRTSHLSDLQQSVSSDSTRPLTQFPHRVNESTSSSRNGSRQSFGSRATSQVTVIQHQPLDSRKSVTFGEHDQINSYPKERPSPSTASESRAKNYALMMAAAGLAPVESPDNTLHRDYRRSLRDSGRLYQAALTRGEPGAAPQKVREGDDSALPSSQEPSGSESSAERVQMQTMSQSQSIHEPVGRLCSDV